MGWGNINPLQVKKYGELGSKQTVCKKYGLNLATIHIDTIAPIFLIDARDD